MCCVHDSVWTTLDSHREFPVVLTSRAPHELTRLPDLGDAFDTVVCSMVLMAIPTEPNTRDRRQMLSRHCQWVVDFYNRQVRIVV